MSYLLHRLYLFIHLVYGHQSRAEYVLLTIPQSEYKMERERGVIFDFMWSRYILALARNIKNKLHILVDLIVFIH